MSVRWQPTDPVYEEAQKQFSEFKSAQLKQAMWASVVRRRFLLQMKAKYAGMHTNNNNNFAVHMLLFYPL